MSTLLQKILRSCKNFGLTATYEIPPFRATFNFPFYDLSAFVITSTLKDDALAFLYDKSNVNNELVRTMSSRRPCIYMYYLYPK